MLAPGIDEEKLVRAVGGGAVGVFARFDVTPPCRGWINLNPAVEGANSNGNACF
jgi:hypothetical protein